MYEQLALIAAPPTARSRMAARKRRYDPQTMDTAALVTAQTAPQSDAALGGTVLEFFAGIGLARMGLEQAGLHVVWANDIDAKKHVLYAAQFPDDQSSYLVQSVSKVRGSDLPRANIAWASFPCTDLSLAGGRSGLAGKHSSTFYEFTRVLDEMPDRPAVVVVENVVGLATSHGGADLRAVILELNRLGYSVDLMTIDARRFVPQSRPRLFLVGSTKIPVRTTMDGGELRPAFLDRFFEDPELKTHCADVPEPPPEMVTGFSLVAEHLSNDDPRWWEDDRAGRFLGSLSDVQSSRLEEFRRGNEVVYRTAYRRTRGGIPVWEIRPDDIAGCLRTARGGSSKQAVVEAGKGRVRVRWMTAREYARLMGAGDYEFGVATTNQVLFGFGDAVCVPAVEWLVRNAVVPLLTLPTGSTGVATPSLGSSNGQASQEIASQEIAAIC